MTPQELFDTLMAYPQPTRTEILNCTQEITRNYEPERVEALLADFSEMLFEWKYNKVVEAMRLNYDSTYSEYEEELHRTQYALAMGTNEPIEWPEAPAPFVAPPPFPGFYDDSNVFVPPMLEYALGLLMNKIAGQSRSHLNKLHPELSTPEASAIFSAAEKAGYCSTDGDGYKWESTTALLAYFIDEASRLLEMRPSNDRIPWSKFAPVFNNLDESTKKECSNEVTRYTKDYKDRPEGWRELKIIIDDALNDIPR